MTTHSYPVHVAAHLDPGLSRWRWLLKWVLVIPHYLVLALLWVAFAVLSVVAFFAILFTGRYPRAIFDFNVGVLRWSWRVAYYAYGALGTDRYPPFSLDERPDYPAHLEVDYPDHLSRGLVLVKWWLLAIPHYLVVALFLGGVGYTVDRAGEPGNEPVLWVSGLIGLMVLVAAVVLLFTGRYPQPVFDFVLGMNRWVLRVAAYAGLMTDEYPPFRLDMGGDDPGTVLTRYGTGTDAPTRPGPAAGAGAPPGSPGSTRWTGARVVGLVLASLLALVSFGLTTGGVALLAADELGRDSAGFVTSDAQRLTTDTYALVSPSAEVYVDGAPGALPEQLLGDVRVTADSATEVFVGLAPTSQVEAWLADVRRDTVVAAGLGPEEYRESGTGAPTGVPADQAFWVAQASAADGASFTWEPTDGDWTLVLMSPDAAAGVDAELSVGAELPVLGWLVALLLSLGLTGLVVAGVVLVLVVRSASDR